MTRAFAHDGLAIAVDGNEDDLIWLEEFLSPAFTQAPIGEAQARVEFSESNVPIFEPPDHESSEIAGDELTAFAMDSGPLILRRRAIENGLRLFDHESPIVFDVSNDRRRVHVQHHDCRLVARARMMRVVREYAHNHTIATGGLILHAAAIAREGRAVAIAGPKGAGKTTMMLRLLERGGIDFISNDRVLVRGADPVRAIGVPTIISWREPLRPLFPRVTSHLAALGDFREHAGERTPGDHHGMFSGPLWHLSASQLCDSLGRTQAAGATLSAVLLLSPHDGMPHRGIRQLQEDEAASALLENLLCRRTGRVVSDVFVTTSTRGTGADLDARCRALAARVPCYSVATSANAIAVVDDHIQDLVDAIVTGRPVP